MKWFFAEFLRFFRPLFLCLAWLFLIWSVQCSWLPPKGDAIREIDIGLAVAVGCLCFWKQIDYVSLRGWRIGLVLGAGLIVLDFWQYKMNWLPLNREPVSYWRMQLWFYILVGCNEELWFRGLWFAQFRDRPWVSVVGGAFVFGGFHVLGNIIAFCQHHTPLPPDTFDKFILMSVGGIFFGIARYRGASLLMIAIPHTLVDLIDKMVGESIGLRFPYLIETLGANLAIYLPLFVLLFWTYRGCAENTKARSLPNASLA